MGEGAVRYMTGKIVGAVLGVCGIIVVIWYWRLAPDDRATLWNVARGTLVWAGLVAALPWALFFVPGLVLRAESNLASAAMLLAYLGIDVALAAYLTHGRVTEGWQKAALLLGFLCAGFYNFVVCEHLARKAEDAV